QDPAKTRGYFKTARQVRLPDIFPRFLYDEVHAQHGVVACEGSMFKSKFANALSTLMAGALGVAAAENKLAIGYGGEAGKMDPPLEALVRDTCRRSFIVARNEASVGVLARLGVRAEVGTDTAWTFEPAGDDVGKRILARHGWDGERPVLVACPINPFWWPVTADVRRAVEQKALGLHAEAHYKSVYFHAAGKEVREKQAAYLDAYATALRKVARDRGAFVVLVGMEELDRRACEGLRERLGAETPVLVSDEHDMFELVSVLRQASALVSSRYHAIVTSMPAGVPSVGVTMDERIRNLMADRGQPELALEVDDPALATKLPELVGRAFDEGERIRAGIAGSVARNLGAMGRMGQLVVEYVRERHPEFPFREELGLAGNPWDHLPSLPRAVRELLADADPSHGGARTLEAL
ncbi:MAG: polysaccharide pyruvyl transferase family protein, partial [Myxococcales bacterium]|nr:polysaccharide pyruvyl transferase family protein [Myxococcales bacterium]